MCFTAAQAKLSIPTEKGESTGSVPRLEKRLLETGLPAWLLGVDGEIIFEAEEIILDEEVFQQVKVPISLRQSGIEVKESSFDVLNGSANLDLTVDRVRQAFAIKLRLNNVHLKTEQNAQTVNNDDKFIFDDTELVPSWTRGLRGNFNVTATSSRIDDIELRDVTLEAASNENSLSLKINGTTNNGNLQGAISHRFDTKKTDIDIQGQTVPLSLISATREYVENIHLDFDIDVVTTGTSARQWVSAMTGEIITEFDDGKINIEKLDKLSQDILSLTLTSLLPISLGPSHSNIECGALKLKTTNGIATDEHSIALRTANLAVMGGGEINFAKEQLAIALHPHARNAGKLNTKTAIKEVSIDGPFQDLTVKPHLGGIINQGISLTTKIANFGLSRIGIPLLDWAAPADVACMKSLQ